VSIISDELRQRQTRLIDTWLIDLRVRSKAATTIETYAWAARCAHRQLPYGIAGSTTDELKTWLWCADLAPSSRRTYRAALLSFCTWAFDGGYIDHNAAALLPTVTVPAGQARPTPQDVLTDILSRAREPYRLWILIAASMGLRCIEIARLDREHVTQEQTWVQGKGGKNAYVPTHPAVWTEVETKPAGPIARRVDGGRADRRDVYGRANKHIRGLGHAGVTMHRMRHWHGTNVYRAANRDLLVAKAALRHASVAMTQRYVEGDDPAHLAALHALPLPI
jgi:integrase/recombinase XerC